MASDLTGAHGRKVYDRKLRRDRCTANSRQSGDRCRNRPRPGATVCRFHGASAPQVAKSARRRLLEAVDPAISALVEIVEGPTAEWHLLESGSDTRAGVWKRVGYDPADKRAAADAILDRAGYPRRQEIDLGDARSRLLERLRAKGEEATG
jgi:hypothetical protein